MIGFEVYEPTFKKKLNLFEKIDKLFNGWKEIDVDGIRYYKSKPPPKGSRHSGWLDNNLYYRTFYGITYIVSYRQFAEHMRRGLEELDQGASKNTKKLF